MKARIVRQGQPLHHKMHGVTEHEYKNAEQEQAPSGTQLSAVMKDLAQAHGPPAPQYASRGIACSLVLYTESGRRGIKGPGEKSDAVAGYRPGCPSGTLVTCVEENPRAVAPKPGETVLPSGIRVRLRHAFCEAPVPA